MSKEFRNAVQKRIEIENKMNKIKELNKSLKNDMENVNKIIINYMDKNNMQNKNIVLNDGKLCYKTTKVNESISKKYILIKLAKYFGGNKDKAKEITDYLYDSRKQTDKVELKRTMDKKKVKS
jgi:hypothetical protein